MSDPAFSQRPATLPCEGGDPRTPGAAQAAPSGFGQSLASRPAASVAQHIASSGSASAAAAQAAPAGFGQVGFARPAAQSVASSPSFAAGDAVSGLGQASASQQGSSLYDEVIQPAASDAPGASHVAAEPAAAPRTFAEFTI